MRRLLRFSAYGLAGLVGLALLLAAVGVIVVQTSWFRDKVRDRIVYEIEKSTGGRVELGAFDFYWRTLTAQVRNLVIHGTEGASEAPLFRVDSVEVGLKVLSILEKQVDLESVVVRTPRINLIVYGDGRTNLPTPKVARKPGRSTLAMVLDLAIKRFNLIGGTVQAQMRTLPLNMLGENLRAQVFYEPTPERYRGGIVFRSLDVQAGVGRPVPIDVDAQFVLGRERLAIPSVHLAANGSTLDVSGTVGPFTAPQADLNYALRANLKELPPEIALGPVLHRGALALTGRASISRAAGYAITGNLDARGLAFRERGIFIENIRVVSAVSAAPDRIEFKDLALYALTGRFDGRADFVKLRDFRVDGEVRGFALHEMTRLQGVHSMVWSGEASGPVHLTGALNRGALAALHLHTEIGIAAVPGEDPVSGSVNLTYDHPVATLSFGPSNLRTRFSRITFNGVLGRQMNAEFETTNLEDVGPAIAIFTAGSPPEIPVKLVNHGVAQFQGSVTGPLKAPSIQGHASMNNFVWTGRQFDRAEADVVISSSGVAARNAALARLGVRVAGAIRVGFHDWEAEPEEPIEGSFKVKSPSLAEVLVAANLKSPFPATTGDVAADVNLSGSLGAPEIEAHAQTLNVVFYGQPIDRLRSDVRYTESRLDITSAQLDYSGSHAQIAGSFEHPKDTWSEGMVSFQVSGAAVNLAQFNAVQDRVSGVNGHIEAQIAGEFSIGRKGFRPRALNGRVGVRDVAVQGQPLGSLELTAATKAAEVDLRLEGDLAGSKVSGAAGCSLEGNYAAHGRLDFTEMHLATLLARWNGTAKEAKPPFNGVVAGTLDFSGNTIDPQSWKGSLQLPTFEIRPGTDLSGVASAQDFTVRNAGPVLADLDSHGVRVRQARFRAKDTNLDLSGRVSFGVRDPWDLRAQGTVNLALLRDFDEAIYSSGSVLLDVSVRGALEHPEVYGRVDLRDASVNVANFPNGISSANGAILLYRDRVSIETLTAESGGGKIAVTGFISLAGETVFHLQAKAAGVRVRYSEGVSSTSNASLTLTGSLDRSVLAGDVTITRVGFNPRSDLGTILARSALPVEVSSQPSRFRQGLRFDVRVTTAPEVRFETTLTKDILADANLQLRGDSVRPVLLGRVQISQGQVMFFGTKYTINSGQILFVNASKIEPNVSLDFETRTQGIDVTLHVSGPVNKLNVTYRSDPPLPFSDILALLTTGREPAAMLGSPGASQFGQSYQQGGASSLVTQAIATPITGRLQRFFGVSRLKIDPEVTGLTLSNAAARVTLEQNITSNTTFTYVTDLSRAQAQTFQVEWDLTTNWSAVAIREENGLFGIDFLYRKQVK